jgi:uncharacterized protein (DUF362 family)
MATRHSDSELTSRDTAMTRREFLGAAVAAVALSGCGPAPYDSALFTRPAISPVGIYPAANYAVDFKDIVVRGLRDLGLDVRGRRVFLKPNMVEYAADTAINTNAMVVVGAALAFRTAGAASVVVGEGPGHRRDIEYLVTQTGLHDHLREERIRFVDLNHDDVKWVALQSRFTKLGRIALPVELLQSDLVVSMPKMKTHHWAGITASMKNFFGVVPGAVYGWPKNVLHAHGIANSILDLNTTIRPHLAIVDAVTAMEGDGPIMGRPRHVGCVVMGRDLVAVDATCARVMGLNPAQIPYLRTAGDFLGNLDDARIVQRGESVSRYEAPFDVVEAFKNIRIGAPASGAR